MTSDFDGLPERVPYRRIAQGENAVSATNPLPVGARFYDTVTGTYLGLRYVDGQPRMVNQTYLQATSARRKFNELFKR